MERRNLPTDDMYRWFHRFEKESADQSSDGGQGVGQDEAGMVCDAWRRLCGVVYAVIYRANVYCFDENIEIVHCVAITISQ